MYKMLKLQKYKEKMQHLGTYGLSTYMRGLNK